MSEKRDRHDILARILMIARDYDPTQALAAIGEDALAQHVGGRGHTSFTPERQFRYLVHVAKSNQKAAAALVAGVSRQTVSRHKKTDPEFAQLVTDAEELFLDIVLEQEVQRRAIVGELEPLAYKGRLTGDHIRKKDTALLKMLYERGRRKAGDGVTVVVNPVAVIQRAASPEAWLAANRELSEDSNHPDEGEDS